MVLSGLARSTYYYYLKHQNTDKYGKEKEEILDIFNNNKGRYGYRRITFAMRNKGYVINHKTVLKLMNELVLKVEMFYGEKFESVNASIYELKKYIHYYNNERISLKLKGMSPLQYRTHSQAI